MMDDTRYGKPNSKRIIVYENTYNEKGHLINMKALEERKTARWFDVGSLSCRCSSCGCKSQKESCFCPNCGAKMEG